MSNYSKKIAILTGDPNGIGAEITIYDLLKLNNILEHYLMHDLLIYNFYYQHILDY